MKARLRQQLPDERPWYVFLHRTAFDDSETAVLDRLFATVCAAIRPEGGGAPAATAPAAGDEAMAQAGACSEYFEEQDAGWCGMHALNNYLGGLYTTQDSCRSAARSVCRQLSQMGLGDAEDEAQHLHPQTGWLSIDVMSALGASTLGLHVEGSAVAWDALQAEPHAAAFVNWNNAHWTILRRRAGDGAWVHKNSVRGNLPRHGCTTCTRPEEVIDLLASIQIAYGSVSLHRVVPAAANAGPEYLEAEGRRAMVWTDCDATARSDSVSI